MLKEPFQLINEQILLLNSWNNSKLITGFTTKNGGLSESPFSSFNLGLHVNDDAQTVATNRNKLSELIDFPTSRWACSDQVHENKVVKVTNKMAGSGVYDYQNSIKSTDGVYTTETNILLALCFADCVPLYFYEPKKEIVGIAHAGWKGTVKNIVGEMVHKWTKDENVDPANIKAAIGPSIGPCCYVVDDHVIHFVNDVLQGEHKPYSKVSAGQYALDLKQLNLQLMVASGILKENIDVSHYCTSCSESLFFSHRRDKGKTGRMVSFIGKKESIS
ncbi:peptidoglycan editing factor PgeF [Evansella cellulosilytica]|uniref:Purine nucleoside phosphorylase n=1 Tax=Evansella cellulosilytica (strain ATCC 21833 / DSM 2522 / FERM P-1141 / JCM 9156 / N-4) TaxID=649639 RepID=E6U282_EVAC2|nr:peptidoglycan editing factor PgeF [Evansella cellulosilytica]ADU30460.1 protein of unknown function DUF152 [Evansella cellulosilytica DSM 2522]